jgi:hypothetical protein
MPKVEGRPEVRLEHAREEAEILLYERLVQAEFVAESRGIAVLGGLTREHIDDVAGKQADQQKDERGDEQRDDRNEGESLDHIALQEGAPQGRERADNRPDRIVEIVG